jgi:predicted nucleic acid-binding protein
VNGYLVDTNVLSEYAKPIPEPRVMAWLRQSDPNTLFASAISLGELRLGIEDLPAGKRRSDLEAWLATGLPGWFAANLLPVTGPIADRWGRLSIQAKRNGTPLATADGLIAATAFEHDLTVVTRNTKDFTGFGLTLINPWEL